MTIDTRRLTLLPGVEELRRRLQSLAMLDAILSPAWEYRYYSFNATWSEGEHLGSMRNGSGEHFFAHFTPAGCWLKGFSHESPMSPFLQRGEAEVWAGVLSSVPHPFAASLREPAFNLEETTFCIWRSFEDSFWQRGEIAYPDDISDPDGSAELLSPLDGIPQTYADWASDYYEREIPQAAVAHIFRHLPLTAEIVAQLNPDVSLEFLETDRLEIGYPETAL